MRQRSLFVAATSLLAAHAWALDPSQVFSKVSPSVWAVRGLDASERPFSYGSGVVIGQGRLVTNCHVLAKAKSIQVRRSSVAYFAKLEHADVERDLCIVSVPDFTAPAVSVLPISSVQVGQRAYAVGNPMSLDLTLSEGLISGVRSEDPRVPPIQTSAAISPGSSGGGLFDDQGRLIGITTLSINGRERLAQNLNFAAPADWIAEIPERAKAQLASHNAPASTKTASMVPGTAQSSGGLWSYTFRDRVMGTRDREFSIRAAAVDSVAVMEILSSGAEQQTLAASTQEISFQTRRLSGEDLIEFSPYLLTRVPEPALPLPASPRTYPGGGDPAAWGLRVTRVQREEASVPAGRFDAYRVTIVGENSNNAFSSGWFSGNDRAVRFEYDAWYAPQVGRYVQLHHRTYGRTGAMLSDEWVQLKSFQPPTVPLLEKKG